jgi:signal transduction histidine kinase
MNQSTLRNWLKAVPPKVLLVLLLTALVSVLVFAVSELAFRGITGQREAAYRSMVGQTTLLRLKERLVQAESAQRGYLLTQQPRYLAPYEKAVLDARTAQASLVTIFGHDPTLHQPITEMGLLVERKLDELDLTVRLAQNKQPGWIKAILRADVELGLMERVEQQSNQINAMLSTRGKEHLDTLTELFGQQRLGVGLVVFLNLSFLAALGATLVRNFYQRQQQQRELTRHAQSLEAAVDLRTQELSELSTYLQNNAEQEKRTLARDLHDEFGALLTSAKLDVAWLQSRSTAVPDMLGRLQQLSNSLDEAVDLKRRVIESLRPSLLDHLGLPAALQWYVQDTCDRADLACDVTVPDNPQPLPPRIAIDLYRLVQEAVNNTIKYAHASVVEVTLSEAQDQWHLSIKDDGVGMASLQIEHLSHGLAGMRHRVRALGGRFDIRSVPAQGTWVQAWVPMPTQG